ncbi:hypothetical protein RUM44_004031 [Polyplax serrata]|uniref:Major facilitator superfamily (MFS) profile domain-containing protein n=2 Tax=Polyplax serrata TaxID=468196 RepID=A0ABR1B1N3_POLSC
MENETLTVPNRISVRYKMDGDKEDQKKQHKKEILVQIAFGVIANLVSIAPGMNLGFSAVALPTLQNENFTFHVEPEEASWIASIASISTPIGCILTGSMLERFGRKLTLITVNIPSLLGWLLIASANGNATLIMIYAGRFFTGLATGMAAVPATVYSAEMSTDKLRGMFITWTSISMSLGILLIYILGYMLQDNWRMLAGVSALFPATALLLIFVFLPESASWLLSRGKTIRAQRSFMLTRGQSVKENMTAKVSNEFELLAQKFQEKLSASTASKKRNILKLFFRSNTIKPFIIMNMFFFFQQFSGIFVIIFYAVDVVIDSGVTMNPYIITILIGAFRVIITILMSYINKKYGRRPPSIVSGAGMTICMAVLATYLYFKNTGKISEETIHTLGWIPATSLLLYIITSTIGFLTLPWAMIGEVFPPEVRGFAAGLTTCMAYIFNFIVVKVYPDMVDAMTEYGVFFFYGSFSLLGTIFVIAFLPETQGKTLAEIEEYFTGNSKSKSKTKSNAIELGEH